MKRMRLIRYLRDHNCKTMQLCARHSVFINLNNNYTVTIPNTPFISELLIARVCRDLGIPPYRRPYRYKSETIV